MANTTLMVYPTFMADHPGLSVEEAMKAQMHETLIAEKVFIGDQDALGGGTPEMGRCASPPPRTTSHWRRVSPCTKPSATYGYSMEAKWFLVVANTINPPHEVYEVLRNHGVVQTEVKVITEAVKPQ
ncbi:hypothetical protein [Actinobaculum massiliense]|uniref:hypothetical protein n=1 Tax=Actinobaculum massiliense TaxID=202789 RepID=UPI00254B506D|nr:hypothetical protein [Actinobaculum massiliense]MDK8318662.1 hypothetical protein [Actinobaculum massiliense]